MNLSRGFQQIIISRLSKYFLIHDPDNLVHGSHLFIIDGHIDSADRIYCISDGREIHDDGPIKTQSEMILQRLMQKIDAAICICRIELGGSVSRNLCCNISHHGRDQNLFRTSGNGHHQHRIAAAFIVAASGIDADHHDGKDICRSRIS